MNFYLRRKFFSFNWKFRLRTWEVG